MVISVGKEIMRAFRRILGDRVNKTSEVDQEAEVKAPVSSGQWTPWAADNGSEHRQGLCAGRGGWLCCDMLNWRAAVTLSSAEIQ